jgi:hypothetical protein
MRRELNPKIVKTFAWISLWIVPTVWALRKTGQLMSDRPSQQKNRCQCKLSILVDELHPDCTIHRFSPQSRELISLRAHYAAVESALPPPHSIEQSHSSRVLELRERLAQAEAILATLSHSEE